MERILWVSDSIEGEGIIFCSFLTWGHEIEFIELPMVIRFKKFKAG